MPRRIKDSSEDKEGPTPVLASCTKVASECVCVCIYIYIYIYIYVMDVAMPVRAVV